MTSVQEGCVEAHSTQLPHNPLRLVQLVFSLALARALGSAVLVRRRCHNYQTRQALYTPLPPLQRDVPNKTTATLKTSNGTFQIKIKKPATNREDQRRTLFSSPEDAQFLFGLPEVCLPFEFLHMVVKVEQKRRSSQLKIHHAPLPRDMANSGDVRAAVGSDTSKYGPARRLLLI